MKNVWIDCDPGIDDTLALIYAIYNPDINILGISVVDGNVDLHQGARNVCALLEFLNVDIPIHKGSGRNGFTDARDTHGENGLGNYYLPLSKNLWQSTGAKVAMRKAISANKNDITIIALGPLTNICDVFADSCYIEWVSEVVIMGGAFRSPGNCSPVSEFNFWCDSESASAVFKRFENCNKLRVVTLDITRQFRLTHEQVNHYKRAYPEIGTLIEGITKYYFDFHKNQEGVNWCVINDVVAVFCAIYEVPYQDYYIRVYCSDNKDIRGLMIVDENNFYHHLPNARLYAFVDAHKSFERSLKVCNENLCNQK